jgi:hypothetical protein
LELMIRQAILVLALMAQFVSSGPADLDRDSIDDALEQTLLERFRPTFMLSANECDGRPSEFHPGQPNPSKPVRNGTIYGQVFPVGPFIEIHYYHLWANDCGFGTHPLDVEQVAVLIAPPDPDSPAGEYVAKYWFGTGHQGTVCDASHGARAADLAAESSGPSIWVSRGKHASFLSHDTCGRLGCGGDTCGIMTAMAPGKLINIGEAGAPLNGANWIASKKWSLSTKLDTEFTPDVLARLDSAEPREIVFIHPELIPAKAFILGGNHTLSAVGTGGKHTGSALKTADKHTSNALDTSARKTGSALKKATRSTAGFLGLKPKKPAPPPAPTPSSVSEDKAKKTQTVQ